MLKLIPTPKILEEKEGILNRKTVRIEGEIADARVNKAAQKLPLSADGIPFITEIGISDSESYTLTVGENEIRLTAGGARGAFYGIQTLRQIFSNETVPCLYIKDEPDMKYRGFLQDITRGQILTIDRFKQLVDDMAYFKLNALQLNVEHTFEFKEFADNREATGCITSAEVRELDDYCYENFIELSPAMASFGHLYMLLEKERYHHLRALENYEPEHIYWFERMRHHTVDPLNPESFELITSLLDQCMPLFRSKRFNICCDETFDLANGRHKGKDTGKLYVDFVKKLAEYVQAHGKSVMMWSDILLQHKDAIDYLPDGIEFLTWYYDIDPDEEDIALFEKIGKPQIVCPGTSASGALAEIPEVSEVNICRMTEYGYRHGAAGVLNTNWGAYGHTASIETAMYSVVTGAEKSWSVSTEINDDFRSRVNFLLYQHDRAAEYVYKLGEIQHIGSEPLWRLLCGYYDKLTFNPDSDKCSFRPSDEALNAYREKALRLIENLKKDEWTHGTYKNQFLLAAQGSLIVIEALAKILGYQMQRSIDIHEWLSSYEKAWLKNGKRGEFAEIEKVIEFIADIK